MPKVVSSVIALPKTGWRVKSKVRRLDPEIPTLGNQAIWSQKVRQRASSIPTRKAKVIRDYSLLKKLSVISLYLVNAALIMVYLVGVNSLASSGYEIKKLQTNIDKQKEQIKELNIQTATTDSMINQKIGFEDLNFVPVGNVQFIESKQLSSR